MVPFAAASSFREFGIPMLSSGHGVGRRRGPRCRLHRRMARLVRGIVPLAATTRDALAHLLLGGGFAAEWTNNRAPAGRCSRKREPPSGEPGASGSLVVKRFREFRGGIGFPGIGRLVDRRLETPPTGAVGRSASGDASYRGGWSIGGWRRILQGPLGDRRLETPPTGASGRSALETPPAGSGLTQHPFFAFRGVTTRPNAAPDYGATTSGSWTRRKFVQRQSMLWCCVLHEGKTGESYVAAGRRNWLLGNGSWRASDA